MPLGTVEDDQNNAYKNWGIIREVIVCAGKEIPTGFKYAYRKTAAIYFFGKGTTVVFDKTGKEFNGYLEAANVEKSSGTYCEDHVQEEHPLLCMHNEIRKVILAEKYSGSAEVPIEVDRIFDVLDPNLGALRAQVKSYLSTTE